MERVPVSSSNVSSVGYDEDSCTLEVEFHGGRLYHYFDVPAHIFGELMSSSSVGSYLAQNVKNVFAYQEV